MYVLIRKFGCMCVSWNALDNISTAGHILWVTNIIYKICPRQLVALSTTNDSVWMALVLQLCFIKLKSLLDMLKTNCWWHKLLDNNVTKQQPFDHPSNQPTSIPKCRTLFFVLNSANIRKLMFVCKTGRMEEKKTDWC